jgi:hypothetical protein
VATQVVRSMEWKPRSRLSTASAALSLGSREIATIARPVSSARPAPTLAKKARVVSFICSGKS